MATKTTITYYKKGRRSLLGFATDWTFVSEAYSEERYRSLELMRGFGAIQNLQAR